MDFGKVPCSSEKERDPLRGHVVRQFVNDHAVKFAAGREKINSFLLAGEAFGHLRTLSAGFCGLSVIALTALPSALANAPSLNLRPAHR